MNVAEIRKDFPILEREVNGKRLVYLDNAATSQKPRRSSTRTAAYYLSYNANVHRAIHALGEQATAEYENARAKVAKFINAPSERNIVWVKNTSEAINLVAYAWGRKNVGAGRQTRFSVSPMEHHSNLVPWQALAQAQGARLRFFKLTDDGRIDLGDLDELLTKRNEARLLRPTRQTCSARSIPSPKSLSGPTRWVALSWSMERRALPICPWMCNDSAAISSPFPPIRCADPRG